MGNSEKSAFIEKSTSSEKSTSCKKTILTVENIQAFYGEKNVLQDINLNFTEKSFTCLIGPNGSGKSTLLNVLCGINNPSLDITNGKVFLKSEDIKKISKKEIAKEISFLPQSEMYSWNHLVLDVVMMGRFPYSKGFFGYTKEDTEIAEKALAECDILHLKDRYIFELSGGEYQQVLIARSLCQETKILVLDEPFTHLDISKQHKLLLLLKKLVAEKDLCVIITLHEVNQAAIYGENLILLKEGKILSTGDVKTVFTKENLETAYETDFGFFQHPEFFVPQVFPR